MSLGLIPSCYHCDAPLAYVRERLTYGVHIAIDRYTGTVHKCGRIWAGIDSAMERGQRKQRVAMGESMRLLATLRLGPVFRSDLGDVNVDSLMQNIRRHLLSGSGYTVVGRWCCPLHGKYPHSKERVYELERG